MHTRGRRGPQFFLMFLFVFALWTMAGCAGCGDNEIATDPTDLPGDLGDGTALEDDLLGDRPFDNVGDQIDDTTANGEDVAPPVAVMVEFEDVFFGYDRFELDADSRAVLGRNARLLRENPTARVLIEGHCDERGTAQYNMALGEKRAEEVKRYLVSLQVPASRIDTVSYGKERPFVIGNGEEAWSQNRRAHFVLRTSRR